MQPAREKPVWLRYIAVIAIYRVWARLACAFAEDDNAKATEVRSLAVYHDRQMAVLRRQRRMEWSFCVGWYAKTQKARSSASAAKKMTKRCRGRSISFKVSLEYPVSVAYIMLASQQFRYGRTCTRRRTQPKRRSGPKIGMPGGRLDAAIQLSWRKTVEGSLSHVRSAVRVRIGVTLAEIAETSRTVPGSARSLLWCTAQR
jgi:hypothetical protein